jgi:adenosylcobinamide-GDP ribazoletransferase
MMQAAWQKLLMAVMFLTRLPVGNLIQYDPAMMLRTPRYFTLVGWLVGLLASGILWVCALLLPWWPAVLLACAFSILLTGAFHEDGFADLCDAFGGGQEKEQVLRIMKDSRLGTYGTLGLVLMLAGKVSALGSLTPSVALGALVAGHVLSRALSTSLLSSLDYVRDTAEDLTAKTPAFEFKKEDLAFTCFTAVPALLLLPGLAALLAIPALWLLHLWLTVWYRRRIGGYTGDCLGGAQQLAEMTVLLLALMAVS